MSAPSFKSGGAASGAQIGGHPRGLYTLFFTEMWERFSYYGMRGMLMLFMIDAMKGGAGFSKPTASAIYGLYTAAVYLVALPGGWIADRLLGARRSVWYGGIIIAAGHFTLAIPSEKAFFLGLLLIVVGTGLLKPNMSVLVGELYPEGGARRDAGFTIFYMGINLGATIGPMICGYLGEKVNWHYGFAAAGVGMALGLIQYRLSARHLGSVGLHPQRRPGDLGQGFDKGWYYVAGGMAALCIVVVLCLTGTMQLNPVALAHGASYLIVGLAVVYFVGLFAFGRLTPIETKRTVVLIVLLLAAAMFFAGFEQAGSSLNLFAEEYTKRVFGFLRLIPSMKNGEFPASWFQSLNPVFIIVFAPVFAAFWVMLGKRHLNPSIPAKFALGLILVGVGFLVMAGAAALITQPGVRVLPTWLTITYLIHTFAELCLSPVGLSAVTKLSPRRYVGQMMGLWFLATSLGNLIAALIAGEVSASTGPEMASIYLRIVYTTAGSGVVLLIFSRWLRRLMGDIE